MINVPHVHACVIGVDQSCQARGRQTYVRTGHILGAGKEGKGQENNRESSRPKTQFTCTLYVGLNNDIRNHHYHNVI